MTSEKHTRLAFLNEVHWSFAHGVVVGVFGTCTAIIGLLKLAVVVKELMK